MNVYISAKCDDKFEIYSELRHEVGYPQHITALCGGDYVDFGIDTTTGKIMHWDLIKEILKAKGFIK
jgi:hypothetical protein